MKALAVLAFLLITVDFGQNDPDFEAITLKDGTLYACPTGETLAKHEWQCGTDSECEKEYWDTFNADPAICVE